jgi:hypothetical protein
MAQTEITFDDLKQAIDLCDGDICEIAELLGCSTHRVQKLIRNFELKDYWMDVNSDSDQIILNFARSVSISIFKSMKNKLKHMQEISKEESKVLTAILAKIPFSDKVVDDEDKDQITVFELPDDGRRKKD